MAAETNGVWITSSHQRCTGWGTQGCSMEIVVAQAVFSQAIDSRGLNQAAKAAKLSEANIIK